MTVECVGIFGDVSENILIIRILARAIHVFYLVVAYDLLQNESTVM